MSPVFRYGARIMAALPGHAPVEIYRTAGHIFEGDWQWKFWVRDMSLDWHCYIERHMPEKFLIGSRPIPAAGTTRGRSSDYSRLKPHEKRAVEALRTNPTADPMT